MSIDDKFMKDLKVAVKPECLIDDSIWFDWFNTFNRTNIYEKKVLHVAKSKKLAWPATKSDETFGYYLAMQFSKVKNSLGWDAKRTLILCLAEEYQSLKSNNTPIANTTISELQPPEITIIAEDATEEITRPHNASGLERIELTCANALEIVNELTSNNKINNDLINLLNDHIARISKENKMLLESKKTTENSTSHMKQLLDDMIKMSQDQIIDIDELSKENKRLMSELETYKSRYFELKSRYDKAKLSNLVIDNFAAVEEVGENSVSVNVSASSDIRNNNQRQINIYQQESPVEVVHLKPLVRYESSDDIKI